MAQGGEQEVRDGDRSRGTGLRVFGTNPEQPDEGRIFVWTKMGWFERIEVQSGAVAFTPIARSESELRELVSRDNPSFDLVQLSGQYRKMVSREFSEQSPSYRDSPEYSHEDPSEKDSQQYHQHD
ncbi:MAG: hypothetical protein A2147_02440 [Chloroflexi bacterium RBG_16_57_8]|nr:MAG: hypothetical protein A2147_02440 [Chloroflexi bacterium RBG_16_57_8]